MFSNQDIIVVAFKLINFAALIGVGFFLFKKHILPDLLLSIARKKNKQDSLFAQQTSLEKQQLQLDIQLKEDAAQCQAFRNNIDEWKKTVAQENNILKKEHESMLLFLQKRAKHAAAQREQHRIQKIVAHTVVEKLEKSLSHHFKKTEESARYLDSIINFMNESAS